MLHLINTLVIILLVIVAYQDFKYRAIWWWLIPLLLAGTIYQAAGQLEWAAVIINFLANLALVVFMLLMVAGYFSIRNKKFTNIIGQYIGLGDVLFLMVVCAAFSTINFLIYYMASLLFILITFTAYNLIAEKKTVKIPLAGGMAVTLIAVMCSRFVNDKIDFYDHDWLLSLLY